MRNESLFALDTLEFLFSSDSKFQVGSYSKLILWKAQEAWTQLNAKMLTNVWDDMHSFCYIFISFCFSNAFLDLHVVLWLSVALEIPVKPKSEVVLREFKSCSNKYQWILKELKLILCGPKASTNHTMLESAENLAEDLHDLLHPSNRKISRGG